MRIFSGPQGGVLLGITFQLICIAIGVTGYCLIENWSLLDSFYMTVISITTVGFSEVNPLSTHGRMFTSFIILIGIGSFFFTTTMLGRVILESELRGTIQRRHMKRRIDKLRDHHVICGFGRTGRTVAEELNADDLPFCVLEQNKELVDELNELGYLYVIGDATDQSILAQAGIVRARTVMALLSSDADNVYLTIEAKELNPRVKVIARALDDKAVTPLKLGGADTVVATYKLAGLRVLQAAVRPALTEFFDFATDRAQLSLALEEVQIEDGSPLVGRSIEQAAIRTEFGIIIVAIKKESGEMVFNPRAAVVLQAHDTLIAIGEERGLKELGRSCRPHPAGA